MRDIRSNVIIFVKRIDSYECCLYAEINFKTTRNDDKNI